MRLCACVVCLSVCASVCTSQDEKSPRSAKKHSKKKGEEVVAAGETVPVETNLGDLFGGDEASGCRERWGVSVCRWSVWVELGVRAYVCVLYACGYGCVCGCRLLCECPCACAQWAGALCACALLTLCTYTYSVSGCGVCAHMYLRVPIMCMHDPVYCGNTYVRLCELMQVFVSNLASSFPPLPLRISSCSPPTRETSGNCLLKTEASKWRVTVQRTD